MSKVYDNAIQKALVDIAVSMIILEKLKKLKRDKRLGIGKIAYAC